MLAKAYRLGWTPIVASDEPSMASFLNQTFFSGIARLPSRLISTPCT
jgi:hypothetical protein